LGLGLQKSFLLSGKEESSDIQEKFSGVQHAM
jgi:hypothetical protein